MPKRSADTQLTKDDMNNGFQFGAGGGAEEGAGSVPMATQDIMSKRKIAPLRRKGARGGGATTPGRSTPGASIPNVFAGIGGNANFGGGAGTNGAASPNPAGFGFGAQPTGPTTPTGFGAGTSGFNFGQQQPEQPKPNPFGGLAPQPAATNGSSGGFTFGNNNAAPAPAANGMFENANSGTTNSSFGGFGSNAPVEAPKPASSSFTFGAAPSAPATAPSANLFGGMNSEPKPFTFGMPSDKKEEGPKPTPSFTFGAATSAPSNPTPAPTSMFGFNPTNNVAPATTDSTPSFQFGAAPSNSGSSLFAKPAELKPAEPTGGSSLFGKPAVTESSAGSSLFGKPTEPASGSSLFGKPPTESAPLSTSLFGKPAEAPASGSSLFGKPAEKTSAPAFGGFQFGNKGNEAEKVDAPASTGFMFGTQPAAEKKEEPAKSPLFGNAAPTSSLFGNAPTPSGGLFGKAPEKPDEQPSAPAFGFKPDAAKTAPAPSAPFFGGFGAQKSAPVPPSTFAPLPVTSPSPPSFFAPPQKKDASPPFTASSITKSASPEPRRQSPPLPSESNNWPSNQLTEYYNLFALRSLNHFFKEEISKADIFADLGPLCEAYQKEATKIRDMMANNQRYKFGEASGTTGSSIPSKRGMEDSEERSGKRRAPGEEPKKVGFASSTPKSASSQALSSVLGGGNGSSSIQKLAEKPAFGFKPPTEAPKSDGGFLAAKPAFAFKPPTSAPVQDKPKETGSPRSIFDSPSPASPSGWVSPFAPLDTSNIPDDNFAEEDDDGVTTKSSTNGTSGSLFDRISPPKDSTNTPSKSLFGGDQTWTPDKGFKFSASGTAPSSNLFGNNSSSGSSLFGNNSSVLNPPTFFGSAAASSAASSTKPSPAPTTDDDTSNEPSDYQPTTSASDLRSGRGPGEENEDAIFESRAVVYDSTSGDKKIGTGQVRVLKHKDTGKCRILARKDLGAVMLNAAIVEGVEYVIRATKAVMVPEFLEDGNKKTWMIRVGKAETAELLKNALTTTTAATTAV